MVLQVLMVPLAHLVLEAHCHPAGQLVLLNP